jgi:LCP family protein required for cell wall assembly
MTTLFHHNFSGRAFVGRLARAAGLSLVALIAGILGMVMLFISPQHSGTAPLFQVAAVGRSAGQGASADVVWALIVGSDSRVGRPDVYGDAVDGARGDALHLIGINVKEQHATMLNIPRDTVTEIPGRGEGRINTGLTFGGLEGQAAAVTNLTGIPVDYVVSVDFDQFLTVVDAIGTITVDVPYGMDDPASGAAFMPGENELNGGQALAYSRNRKSLPCDGIPERCGDWGRTMNQGQLIIEALRELQSRNVGIVETISYVEAFMAHGSFIGMSPTELYRLGRLALDLEPDNIDSFLLPSESGRLGSASVVRPTGAAAGLLADMADDGIVQSDEYVRFVGGRFQGL